MSSSLLVLIFTGAIVFHAPKDAKDPWNAYLLDMGGSHPRLLRVPLANVESCPSPCKEVVEGNVCQCSLVAGDLSFPSQGGSTIVVKKQGLPTDADHNDIQWLLRMGDLEPNFKISEQGKKDTVRVVFNWTSAETCAFDEVRCWWPTGAKRKVYEIDVEVDGKSTVRQAVPELVAFKADLVGDTIEVPVGNASSVKLKLKKCASGCPVWLSNSAGSGGGGGSCLPLGLGCEEKSGSHLGHYWKLAGSGPPGVVVARMCNSSVSLSAKQPCSHVVKAPWVSTSTTRLINYILEEVLGGYNWWTVGDRIICPPVLVE